MKLFESRRFWMTILDVVIAIAGYVAAHFIPSYEELIKFLIVTLQPVIILVIIAYTVDDVNQAKIAARAAKQ
jgi:hypothetical protein